MISARLRPACVTPMMRSSSRRMGSGTSASFRTVSSPGFSAIIAFILKFPRLGFAPPQKRPRRGAARPLRASLEVRSVRSLYTPPGDSLRKRTTSPHRLTLEYAQGSRIHEDEDWRPREQNRFEHRHFAILRARGAHLIAAAIVLRLSRLPRGSARQARFHQEGQGPRLLAA